MKDDRLLEMRVFKAVVDAGGFTAAAHVLGVSQPFVSQSVRNLERRLGVQLLHRSTRGRRLTDEGERFLALSAGILDGIEQGEAQIASSRTQPKGDLRVSVPLGFGMDQIVPRLPEFLARHPKIKLHLSLTDDTVNLIGRNVDVAVTMGRLQDSSLVSRKLCSLQRLIVASPAYIARQGEPRAPKDLAAHNCLMFEGARERLNRWPFLVAGKRVEIAVRGNFGSGNGITLFQLCAAGVGIMRCGEHLALPAIRAKTLVPLLAQYQADEDTAIHAVILPERQLLQRIRTFVDFLVEILRRPPWIG